MAPSLLLWTFPWGTVAEKFFPGGGLRGSRPPEACVFSGKRRWTQCLSGRTDISMPEDGQNIFCTACGRRGVCVLIGRALWRYLKLKRRLKRKAPDPGEAFILGVWRPRVFISPDTPEDLRRHMEEHEKEHLRREDYFVKAAAYALCCIYWFHPLVWLAFRQSSRAWKSPVTRE